MTKATEPESPAALWTKAKALIEAFEAAEAKGEPSDANALDRIGDLFERIASSDSMAPADMVAKISALDRWEEFVGPGVPRPANDDD